MKININKALAAATMTLAMAGCANHDLIPDIAQVGQAVPTVYWEVGSTVCKAGESFSFQGKYNNQPGRTPIRSEVWYEIVRDDVAAVSTKLGGASLNYTQTASANDVMRSYQCAAVFPHQAEYWDGHQNIFTGTVPVSRTLTPVMWVDPAEFDADRFASFYPEGFVESYLEKIYGYLTDEASAAAYYNALRTVYLNYAFTNEQFAAVGLPELDLSGDDNGTAKKSDAWYAYSSDKPTQQVGVYFITLDAEGNVVYNERPMDYEPAEGQMVFPVYDAAEWVFCRYDDNSGSVVTSVRPEWLPRFRTLIEQIPFEAWIYDSANGVYKIDFSRRYSLNAQFRSYDKNTNQLSDPNAPEFEGVTSKTDLKTISIN